MVGADGERPTPAKGRRRSLSASPGQRHPAPCGWRSGGRGRPASPRRTGSPAPSPMSGGSEWGGPPGEAKVREGRPARKQKSPRRTGRSPAGGPALGHDLPHVPLKAGPDHGLPPQPSNRLIFLWSTVLPSKDKSRGRGEASAPDAVLNDFTPPGA